MRYIFWLVDDKSDMSIRALFSKRVGPWCWTAGVKADDDRKRIVIEVFEQ